MNINDNIFYWNNLTDNEKIVILSRPLSYERINIKNIIKDILKKVRINGDKSLFFFTKKYDNYNLKNFYISLDKIEQSSDKVSIEFKKSISVAKKNIEYFHKKNIQKNIDVLTTPGVICQKIVVPIDSVGLYIPKGDKPLVSTALMLLVPAILAGCKDITLCTPPPIHNEILYISKICGIRKILNLGGAQAIAAMSFGTESVKKVDKIFGPGNIFVTEAKLQVSKFIPGVSIDMIAGPSEVLIISDDYSNPNFIASDLLSQSEHDFNSQVILISTSISFVCLVINCLKKQILNLSKKKIILKSLKNSKFIIAKDIYQCIDISNQYAPEHLILNVNNHRNYMKYIRNAGSVFLGQWTPESAGDYITGSNHVLPTNGYSKTFSSIDVMSFQKFITFQEITSKEYLKNISNDISVLSNIEGMDAHYNSIKTRLID